MNWKSILMTATHVLAAAAHGMGEAVTKFEGSTGGATVAADASKTLSDAKTAALGYVKQGLTQPATDELAKGLKAVGLPSEIATAFAGIGVAQGESWLSSLI